MGLSERAEVLLAHAPPEVKRLWVQKLGWRVAAHPFQRWPDGEWGVWLLKGGRGCGKTRTGAQMAAEHMVEMGDRRVAIVAPTFPDGRDVCVEGESGLLSVLDGMGVAYRWNRSIGEVVLESRSRARIYSAEKPNRLRGPQHSFAWCDEIAVWADAYKGPVVDTAWTNLRLGLRLGVSPRIVATTTPRRVALVRYLVEAADVVVTTGTTRDNLANLAASFGGLIEQYEGTGLGRQEIEGELLADAEGALWQMERIGQGRLAVGSVDRSVLRRVVVGVDPQGSLNGVTGIVAVGLVDRCPCGMVGAGGHGVVLEDGSVSSSPAGWAYRVREVAERWDADLVVAERNYGGEMVESTIRAVWPKAPLRLVVSSRGKALRAEPVAALYERGLIHHMGVLPMLEDEMVSWEPDSGWSPDRLDAMVFAVTALEGVGALPEVASVTRPTMRIGVKNLRR